MNLVPVAKIMWYSEEKVESSILKCLCWREYGDEVEEGSH